MNYKSAIISSCGKYRYQLERRSTTRTAKKSTITFIGLNPSTADANNDDPTLRRCIDFALTWQYRTLILVNLFAWRSTDPANLTKVTDPIGDANDEHIKAALARSSRVVACWGEHGALHNRADAIMEQYYRRLYALKVNRSGQPAHPLYLPKSSILTKLAKLRSQLT